ncbi:MAG: type ISP restriction/modification enzyme, partial [Balneolaceae bacterium]
GDSIRAVPEAEDKFRQMINDFATHSLQTIKSASKLSKMMAGKARLLSTIIENALNSDEQGKSSSANNTLHEQLSAFQNVLIHDIDAKEFADIYAQTIAYGMFAARLHDTSLETFSRQEAARLIPKTNPFLRKLFQYIAGYDLDERIDWVVDALADIFRATDVDGLLNNFGKSTQQTDPIIHFYETFLAEFDPKLRKSRGVWYTPEPVVNFIVRAVDDILKDEFGLKDGLADTSKTKVKVKVPTHDKRHKGNMVEEEREVHKVQILDPAAGTGTFLAEVIKQIHSKFEGQQGIWPDYVENHLIPRLNGFEILMASYAMAHLKLDLLLKETGFDRESDQRFRVYLTNSLEEHHPDTGTLFAGWLSSEANEANHIKRDTPVMVVLGNPPYSGISSNMGDWISGLIEDYKYVDGEHFGERKHWLHDDYVKFIRYGQHFVEKNGEGVLAFINNHGFLENPTFRGMRWNLLSTFDKIYVIDLHGNTMKNEICPLDEPDQNVFDIQQGVSLNIFVKSKTQKDSLAKVYHSELWGKRNRKYEKLKDSGLGSFEFEILEPSKPFYFFIPMNYSIVGKYNEGFSLNELFNQNVTGIVTARDSLVIDDRKEDLIERIKFFSDLTISDDEVRSQLFPNKKAGKYLPGDSRGWKLTDARQKIADYNHKNFIKTIQYRPLDFRFIYYSSDMVDWGRENLMPEIFHEENLGIVFPRQAVTDNWSHIQITNALIDNRFHYSNKGIPVFASLYVYNKNGQKNLDGTPERKPNLEPKIVKKIADGLGLAFTPEKEETKGTFAPIDLLDYIYAVLHSPTYRETYKEFLKIDFPRVPYPDDVETFWKLVELGGDLRQIHLMEHPVVNKFITTYPKAGSNKITNRLTKNDPGFVPDEKKDSDSVIADPDPQSPDADQVIGKVWINDEQYFGNVPLKAWEFYIGGYQPAEKWLKDRRDRTLTMEEIQHYQKIIVALMETDRLMREIDGVFEN